MGAVVVVLDLQLKPGRLEDFKTFLKEVLPDTRAFEGCRDVTFHTDQDDADRVVVLENWDSRQHYERYFAWRTETGVLDTLGEMLAGPVAPRYFDPLHI